MISRLVYCLVISLAWVTAMPVSANPGTAGVKTANPFPAGSYDCELDPARWLLVRSDTIVEMRHLNFPELAASDWRFRMELAEKVGARITMTGKDPLGLGGTHGTMSTGNGSYTLATYAEKGCVLTDAGCAVVLQIVVQEDKSLKLLALPSAIITLDDDKITTPFNAFAPGRCRMSGEQR